MLGYLTIITLKLNALNVSIRNHTVGKQIKNKSHIFSACKTPTSDLKTHKLKMRDGKKYSLQMKRKEKQACL